MSNLSVWRCMLLVVALSFSNAVNAASCQYSIVDEWAAGYTASVIITNDSDEVLNGWSVVWAYNDGTTIPNQPWNAQLSGASPYSASNVGHNAVITPGSSVNFGFNATKGLNGSAAQIPDLGGVCSEQSTNQAPISEFTLTRTSGRVPFDISFNGTRSSDPDGSSLNYLWDFGDGETSTEATLTKTFTQPGTYTVSLTVNDGALDSQVSIRTIVANEGVIAPANQAPVSAFTLTRTSGRVPFNITFDGRRSSDPDSDALNYFWDFGDGETSTDAAITKTFTQAGTYEVSLTVNDGELDSPASVRTIVANEGSIEPNAYVLDSSESSLYFLSTKNTHTVETHHFDTLSGAISTSGSATLIIDLNSVETNVDIRNDRVRSLLFETASFSQASVALPVDMSELGAIEIGSTDSQTISATVNLHGVSAVVSTQVAISRLTDSKILVESVSPIIIEASTFNLTSGIDALREIANLSVISYTVPVNFTLFFDAL